MKKSDEEQRVDSRSMNIVLSWYFKLSSWKLKKKVNGKLKGVTQAEKKTYVKEIVATLLVAIQQWDAQTISYNNTYFDGALTQVLNSHKNIKFKYKDWVTFMHEPFDADKARKFMSELYNEFEYIRTKK